MAKLSSIILCDGAVLSFGQWTLVGVSRTLWSDHLPFTPRFTGYVCATDVRRPTPLLLELFDPIAAANGETGAVKWHNELLMECPLYPSNFERCFVAAATEITRAVPHELHITVAGTLADVVTIDVVA